MAFAAPSRRQLLQLAGTTVIAPLLPAATRVHPTGRVLAVADLHSAYERTAQLLAAFESEVARNPAPHVIAVNGDVFEYGNRVSVRSGGVVDWAFLAELPRLAPTVVNLGNHDNDLTPDLAEVVARMRGLGLRVVSTLRDARTGADYAAPSASLPLGDRTLRVVGVATDALNTYPKASHDRLAIPAPAEWARANLERHLAGADLTLVLSHAGVQADREILPLLPEGALMIGGHNHLLFQQHQGRMAYAHTGSWTNAYTVAEFAADGAVSVASRPIAADGEPSPRLADLIASTMNAHLTPEEREVLGSSARAMSLGDTGRAAAVALARAACADAGFIGHTTLGAELPAGPVTRHVFDAVVRFDGKVMRAVVPRVRYESFMARANQDRPMPLSERSGDFLYAAGGGLQGALVRIATTDWCAANQQEYFGTQDLVFEEVPGLAVKWACREAMLAV